MVNKIYGDHSKRYWSMNLENCIQCTNILFLKIKH